GLSNTAIRSTLGTSSCSRPSRFASIWFVKKLTPVRLPPGRLRLATRPDLTGSAPIANTMGMVEVAAFIASAETSRAGKDHGDFGSDEFGGKRWQSTDVAFRKNILNRNIATLIKAGLG